MRDDLDQVTGSFARGRFEGRQVLVSGASGGIGIARPEAEYELET